MQTSTRLYNLKNHIGVGAFIASVRAVKILGGIIPFIISTNDVNGSSIGITIKKSSGSLDVKTELFLIGIAYKFKKI